MKLFYSIKEKKYWAEAANFPFILSVWINLPTFTEYTTFSSIRSSRHSILRGLKLWGRVAFKGNNRDQMEIDTIWLKRTVQIFVHTQYFIGTCKPNLRVSYLSWATQHVNMPAQRREEDDVLHEREWKRGSRRILKLYHCSILFLINYY